MKSKGDIRFIFRGIASDGIPILGIDMSLSSTAEEYNVIAPAHQSWLLNRENYPKTISEVASLYDITVERLSEWISESCQDLYEFLCQRLEMPIDQATDITRRVVPDLAAQLKFRCECMGLRELPPNAYVSVKVPKAMHVVKDPRLTEIDEGSTHIETGTKEQRSN